MNLEALTLQEMPVLAQMEQICFREPWTEEQLVQEYLKNPFFKGLVLKVDGTIIGYCILWVIYEQAQIARIAILPDFRKQGYGFLWIQMIIEYAKDHGCQKLTLEVRHNNMPAISMYEKAGMKCIHTIASYYSDGDDAKVYEIRL